MALQLLDGLHKSNIAACHLEADQFFIKDGVYKYEGMKIGAAHEWCMEQTALGLSRGKHVIVSNTFTTKKELTFYFDAIQEYGMNPTIILMQSSWGSIHNVPDDVILKMAKRFQHDLGEMFL